MIFVPSSPNFHGLWGVFADSLPDTWGRLLVDCMLKSRKISPASIAQLDRLVIVGRMGMGALVYRPAWDTKQDTVLSDLDELAAKCQMILKHEDVSDLDGLSRMGGSSGGARPRVMTDERIIKFPVSGDMKDRGLMEKEYIDCAADCGIIVPETKLMPSGQCCSYFAVRRSDREIIGDNLKRRHMVTAAILEADWHTASLDYHTLMKMTKTLSLGNEGDME